ncbi:ABC transporter permease [Actinotalea sp. C106]|uniref:ABC transporter permease n=1 Tax=Actinotalea sp. C106 TaxID=2908644 RepID=UPI0020277FE3|nr:ABC transporter permease [Actinotalea sp. C106]
MRAALAVEALKLRRATAPRVAGLAVVLGVPAVTTGFIAAAEAAPTSQLALKVAPMLVGDGWVAQLSMVGQILSVAVLLSAGVVAAWVYGREHVDGTIGGLYAVPVRRRDVAVAKALVLLAWGVLVLLATLAVSLAAGAALGQGGLDSAATAALARAVLVGLLTLLLALPVGTAAHLLRGYLPGIGVLLAVVVVTQVVTVAGAGAWFPYAAPGTWAGMGGPELAEAVLPVQLALPVPVALGGVMLAAWWSERAEVR